MLTRQGDRAGRGTAGWVRVGRFRRTNYTLRRVALSGGPRGSLLTLDAPSSAATWAPDDTIVFASRAADTGLRRIPADGGTVTVLTRPDPDQGEANHAWPDMDDRRYERGFATPSPRSLLTDQGLCDVAPLSTAPPHGRFSFRALDPLRAKWYARPCLREDGVHLVQERREPLHFVDHDPPAAWERVHLLAERVRVLAQREEGRRPQQVEPAKGSAGLRP